MRRIKQQKQSQSLIHSLRQTNEPFLASLGLPIASSVNTSNQEQSNDNRNSNQDNRTTEDNQMNLGRASNLSAGKIVHSFSNAKNLLTNVIFI